MMDNTPLCILTSCYPQKNHNLFKFRLYVNLVGKNFRQKPTKPRCRFAAFGLL